MDEINRWTDMNRWTDGTETDVSRWTDRMDRQMEQINRWNR